MFNVKEFNGLTKSENKKILKGRKGYIGEYFYQKMDEHWGLCEVTLFDVDDDMPIDKVTLSVCLWDRRRSFVASH